MASSTVVAVTTSPSGRLVHLLLVIPTENRNYFCSLLAHTELIRLSRCCRSLKESILDDAAFWREHYKHTFLSGPYYEKELHFVLWCARTASDAPEVPARRSDLLKH